MLQVRCCTASFDLGTVQRNETSVRSAAGPHPEEKRADQSVWITTPCALVFGAAGERRVTLISNVDDQPALYDFLRASNAAIFSALAGV